MHYADSKDLDQNVHFFFFFFFFFCNFCQKMEQNANVNRISHLSISTQAGKELYSKNLSGSKIFGTMGIYSRHGQFEPMRVNHGARSGS